MSDMVFPKCNCLLPSPCCHDIMALQATCQALEAERDAMADGLNEAGAALTVARNKAQWEPTEFTAAWFLQHADSCLDRLVNHPNLKAEAQLSALLAVLAEIEQEMRDEDWSQHTLQPAGVELVVNAWADRLRGIRQTEDRTAEQTDHARVDRQG